MFDALLYKKHPQLFKAKIRSNSSPVLYYLIIAAFIVTLAGYIIRQPNLSMVSLAAWMLLNGFFIYKRLRATKLSLNHIGEMIVTSFIIPFLSVYWQWYGAVKYRVLFI